ncbi:hypothetical protein SCLCIDRAFT_122416, partial [Scleroderma citrinum Foug A]
VAKGLFMHNCILDTLAFFLESTQTVPSDVRSRKHPRTALALATVAVESAFKHWSTGYYALPESKPLQNFSATLWRFATNEVLESVDKLSPRRWEKIQEAASEYIGAHKPTPRKDAVCAQKGLVSGRATCFEADTD